MKTIYGLFSEDFSDFSFKSFSRISTSYQCICSFLVIYDEITWSTIDTERLTFLYLSVYGCYSFWTSKTSSKFSFIETKTYTDSNCTIFSEF